jgi:hypothetical protein
VSAFLWERRFETILNITKQLGRKTMKILSNTISSGSGSAGGTTLTRSRGGLAFRSRRIPSNKNTDAQQAARAGLSATSSAWQKLTAAQQAAWTTFAQSLPVTDKLGQKMTLSGFNMFTKYAAYTIIAGENPASYTAPTPGYSLSPPLWSAAPIISGGSFDGILNSPVIPANFPSALDVILIYTSRPVSKGKSAAHQPFALASMANPDDTVAQYEMMFMDIWPNRGAGTPVIIKTIYVSLATTFMYATAPVETTIISS